MYSQNKEDDRIWGYFQQRGVTTGRLLDIGANDGITLSNSRMFIERGWHADLVEPSPAAFRKLSACLLIGPISDTYPIRYENYSHTVLHNFAITDTTGEIDFWECDSHLTQNDVSLLATADAGHVERWKRHKSAATGKAQQFTQTKVNSYKWKDSPLSKQKYDYISIDVEGNNFPVLSQIDLSEVLCLCIEWSNSLSEHAFITGYCMEYGLNEVHKNYENVIFCK